jgi:hypothetical protein
MAKRKRFSAEQTIMKLREAEVLCLDDYGPGQLAF